MNAEVSKEPGRDSFRTRRGFILACIGSAVGMGNIWLFPTRISKYGGATFLIPYLIFVVLIASTGVMEEMAFGRWAGAGPIGAFGKITERRFGNRRAGEFLGMFPMVSSLALAIGYTVVVGWILKYLIGSLTGSSWAPDSPGAFGALFGKTASAWGNTGWQTAALVLTMVITAFGIGAGIEKANKIMMPLFYVLFIGMAVYTAQLDGASAGYRYIFLLKPSGLLDPRVWIYALGQAFFSLSVAGHGTLIYGSYLDDSEDVPNSAKYVAIFDTFAALLAALVIIPAMASCGQRLNEGGPGLMFIYLPFIFRSMPGGRIFMILFFAAVLFASLTSLVNLYECAIATLQDVFRLRRVSATAVIAVIGLAVSLSIQGIVSGWMDVCSTYFCPIGAGLAAILFYWAGGKDFALAALQKGRARRLSPAYFYVGKYVYCIVTGAVLVMGAVLGGIG